MLEYKNIQFTEQKAKQKGWRGNEASTQANTQKGL